MNTTLDACLDECLQDVHCLAARFTVVMGTTGQTVPCQLCTEFQPGPTEDSAMLIPMMHRCSAIELSGPWFGHASGDLPRRPVSWANTALAPVQPTDNEHRRLSALM